MPDKSNFRCSCHTSGEDCDNMSIGGWKSPELFVLTSIYLTPGCQPTKILMMMLPLRMNEQWIHCFSESRFVSWREKEGSVNNRKE